MDLESRKLSFIQKFIDVQDEDIVTGLEDLLKRQKAKFYEDNLKPMSIEQLNSNIDHSLEDSLKGRVISAIDLKEKVKGWS
ncbi:MAG: hypothetical protein WBG71_05590 [Leeuwenhoekiella sp.]